MWFFGVSMMNNHIYGSKVPQKPHFGGLNRHFKPNVRKIQIAISSDLCNRIDINIDRQLRPATDFVSGLVRWYRGKTIPRWRTAAILKIDILPYFSEKSSDFHEILYTAADFKLNHIYWLRGTVGRTSVFDRRTFPVLRSTCS